MGLGFEWDESKARRNLKKHGVSFEEAASVFGDPLSLTIPDPLHSEDEERFVTLGESRRRRLLVVVATNEEKTFESSVPVLRRVAKGSSMKKATRARNDKEILAEYDFTEGVRGKYAKRYAEGNNIVLLAKDVAEVFPDSASVNEALRALVAIAQRGKKRTSNRK